MNNLADIQGRVRAEVLNFYQVHKGEAFAEGYLFYRATTNERDGGILAVSKRPGEDWFFVDPENLTLSPDATVQRLSALGILSRLPVLGRE